MKKVVCITVGHNKGTGARAHDGTDEWTWNMGVADLLKKQLEDAGYEVHILLRDSSLGYTSAMRKLARDMKKLGADIALDLHFNAASPTANGYEFLHWWGSSKSEKLAQCVAISHGKHFSDIIQRGGNSGARSLWFRKRNEHRAYSGRGGAYCFLTPCPAIICEPGFGSNRIDWKQLKNLKWKYAKALVVGVDSYFSTN